MKRIAALLALACLAGALIAPAEAAKKKAVKTTLYLHGTAPAGEIDGAQWMVDYLVNSMNNPMAMDSKKPSDPAPKSMNLQNPALNTECTGLPAGFPTWLGDVSGTIKGDATLTVDVVAAPGTKITARLWPDLLPFQGCNEGYIKPASEVVVDVPAGQSTVKIKFPKLNFKAQQYLMLELLGGKQAEGARVLYDSASAMSNLQFNCIPAKGKSCV